MPSLQPCESPGTGVSFLECRTDEVESRVLAVWDNEFRSSGEVPLIVTARNEGVAGIDSLNRFFHMLRLQAASQVEVKSAFGEWFGPGDPCAFKRTIMREGYSMAYWGWSTKSMKRRVPLLRCLTATTRRTESSGRI